MHVKTQDTRFPHRRKAKGTLDSPPEENKLDQSAGHFMPNGKRKTDKIPCFGRGQFQDNPKPVTVSSGYHKDESRFLQCQCYTFTGELSEHSATAFLLQANMTLKQDFLTIYYIYTL